MSTLLIATSNSFKTLLSKRKFFGFKQSPSVAKTEELGKLQQKNDGI